MKIEEIEKQARDLKLSACYFQIMRAIYASAMLQNLENGNKKSELACIKLAQARFERAWNIEERLPVARASTDVMLVQILKDEIATAMVGKLVDK